MGKGLLAVIATFAVLAPDAAAQIGIVPGDNQYSGGDTVAEPNGEEFAGRPGDSNVSLRTSPDGARVRVSAVVLHGCTGSTGKASGAASTILYSNAGFEARTTERVGSGRDRVVNRLVIRGRIEGDRASGTVESTTHRAHDNRRICRGTANWAAVRTPWVLSRATAPAPAGAVLRGSVARSGLFDISLRVAPDASAVMRVNISTPFNCGRPGRESTGGWESFYEEGAAIKPDGTFRIRNTWTTTWAEGPERTVMLIIGRFVEGGAVGTVEVDSLQRGRRSRRPIWYCQSGRQPWLAVAT